MELNKKEILSKKYGSELLNFLNVVSANLPVDINLLVSKITNLKIGGIPTNLKDIIIKINNNHPCVYYPKDNKIFIVKSNFNIDSLYHELFHMISSFYQDDIIYSGFKQKNEKENILIGKGINEGYTQLLKERYFNQASYEKYVYLVEKNIAKHIEMIIGKRKMEELYVSSNLPALIKELENYSNEDVVRFIENVDYLNLNAKNCENIQYYIDLVNNKLRDTSIFLLDAYIKKQTYLLENHQINIDRYYINIENFIASIARPIEYKDRCYTPLNYDDVEKILKSNNLKVNDQKR